MRPFLAAAAAAVLLLAEPAAARPGTATTYGPMHLFGGYSEKEIEPGVWKITGRSNGIAEPGFGRNMAVYRAAELMREKGFSFVQILNQKGKEQSFGIGGASMRYAGESLTVTVRGTNDPAETLDCRAKKPEACMTLPVDRIIAMIGPQLTFREKR